MAKAKAILLHPGQGRINDAVFCMWEQPYKNLRTLRRRREAPSGSCQPPVINSADKAIKDFDFAGVRLRKGTGLHVSMVRE